MKMNTRACYAIRLMTDVARHSVSGQPVPLKQVADRQSVSKLYLAQLTIPLRNAALLRSVWGNKGGYLLARPPGEIRLIDIIETVDGPIGVMDCVLDPNTCERLEICDCYGVFCEITKKIVDMLSKVTLYDLVASKTALQEVEKTT